MTFDVVMTPAGERLCFVDGLQVPDAVYDTLRPSKLFPLLPGMTGMTEAEAVALFETIRDSAPPPAPHKGPYFGTAIHGAKPLRSDALACHPKQIAAAKARNKKHGLSVDYDRHGRPVFTDAGQRRKLMKIEGVRQQNSYYGA